MERAKLAIVWVPNYHRSRPGNRETAACQNRHGPAAEQAFHARVIRWDNPEAANALAVTPCQKPSGENRRIIGRYLDELNTKQRLVVTRIVMHGEKTADVAHDMGLSRQRVEAIKKLAMNQLKLRILEERPEWGTT